MYMIPGRSELQAIATREEAEKQAYEDRQRLLVMNIFCGCVRENAVYLIDGASVKLYWQVDANADALDWLMVALNDSNEYIINPGGSVDGFIWEITLE